MRATGKFLLIIAFFVSLFFLTPNVAHAQADSPCIPPIFGGTNFTITGCVFGKITEAYPEIDIIRTMVNSPTVVLVNFMMTILTDASWDQMIACAREQQPLLQSCQIGETPSCGFSVLRSSAQGNGSLYGLAYKTGYYVNQKDILPVNLALWFKDEVKDIPVVGDKAYAQLNYPNVIAAEFVLTVWRQFRNLAYGILSVIMVVVGILIMTRKKVNPQLVVTLQNAIPRIIIALILITFSYPIGATAASFTAPLMQISGDILTDIADVCIGGQQPTHLGGISLVMLIIPMLVLDMGILSVGTGTLFFILLVLGFGLVIMLLAFFKFIIVYVKILASIVFAPIVFAFGAIPGNEDMIVKWFKVLAARVLSIPAMFFMISLAYRIPLYAFTTGYGGNNFLGFSGTIFAELLGSAQNALIWVITPFIMFMILAQTLSVPKKVEEWIVGKPRR